MTNVPMIQYTMEKGFAAATIVESTEIVFD